MKRLIFPQLQRWKDDPKRKPILLRGARQVGKTWIVRELGKSFPFFVEVNFELYPEVREIFQQDLNPRRIIRDLALLLEQPITPGETLLFLDEIQGAPEALNALRFFYEMLPELHVIAAGSLLDFQLERIGMPVGRVISMYLHPMSFLEFLVARNQAVAAQLILEHPGDTPLSPPLHRKMLRLLGEYMAVGGMPEAVASWCATESLEACRTVHYTLIDAYRQDFNKYARKYQIKYVGLLFDTVPALMGNIFQFSQIPGNYRARDLRPALDLLEKAGLVHRVVHSAGQGIPLGAQANWKIFKLLFLDIGLAQTILGLTSASWLLQPEKEFANKGGLNEALVGQELIAYSPPNQKPQLYFWKRDKRGSNAEVDYLWQHDGEIIPLEVKSSAPGRLKSLRLFLQEHPHTPYGIRFAGLNYDRKDQLHSFPLYAVARAIKPGFASMEYLLKN